MIAPDYETIFDVETQVELGVQAALQNADWNLDENKTQVILQRDNIQAVTPRIDVQFALGKIQGHYGKDNHGRLWHDAWLGALTLTVFTNRTNNSAAHGTLRARIRQFMQYAEGALSESIMPYHTLSKIAEDGTTPTIEADENIDMSEIKFSCCVSVRTNAWPLAKN